MRRILAGTLLLFACKSNTPEATPPQPGASASASASASSSASVAGAALVMNDVDASASDASVDEGGTAMASTDNGSALPPLAKGAAWSVVRWDMSPGDVEAAFAKAGVKAEAKNDVKTGAMRTAVKGGAWSAVIYFTNKKPEQIVVTGSSLSKDAAAAVTAKMKERAGAPTQTTERIEARWRKVTAAPGATSIVVANDGTVREEYVKDGAAGNVGFAKLTWGMTPDATKQALVAAGYVANVTKNAGGIDPCALPNAPPDCAKRKGPPDVVTIVQGDREGKASFDDKGLTQVEISGATSDKGAARLAEIEKALGKPTSRTHATKTSHADDVAKIDLDVEEKQPEGTFTVHETYRPKK